MQTAPTGFAEVGWKYYLVIICWSVFFIPVIYFFWPETAQLSLEEIGKNFGDEVAVHVNYHGSPLTTIKPEEDQPAFTIDSDESGTKVVLGWERG